MNQLRADEAKVEWVSDKKHWHVVITVGAEVIKRTLDQQPQSAGDDALRSAAVAVAKDEGYELDRAKIGVVH
jgi:hypothetical protein